MDAELGITHAAAGEADSQSLAVDSAIGHCEKLRRVLELEAWIREARGQPILAPVCEEWRAEHGRLLAELHLSH